MVMDRKSNPRTGKGPMERTAGLSGAGVIETPKSKCSLTMEESGKVGKYCITIKNDAVDFFYVSLEGYLLQNRGT